MVINKNERNVHMLVPQIFPVTSDSRRVGQGSLFVAIAGHKEDGHLYIQKAIDQGAVTIVIEKTHKQRTSSLVKQNEEVSFIFVKNARKALAELSSKSLGNPASKLTIIGITGTKGKTTTTYMIEYMLRSHGFKTALLGSITNKILDEEEPSILTTPESDYLQMFLATCVKRGVEYVIMEVSSHALSLSRIHNITFKVVGFSNLDTDHLDFYPTMEDYFNAKILLFDQAAPSGTLVLNNDHEWGERAFREVLKKLKHQQKFITYSRDTTHNYASNNPQHTSSIFTLLENSLQGLRIALSSTYYQHYELNLPNIFGAFNAYNSVMAFIICLELGLNDKTLQTALTKFPGVPGRLQPHRLSNGALAFVDFAHNAVSFQNLLSTLRNFAPKLIIVFGCGGNKDKGRRPAMGALAALYGDIVILTDDNPRFEDRHAIIQDILHGIPEEKRSKVTCEPDRKKAIAQAAALSDHTSVIAILGKGHETYYLIQGQKIYFNDLEEIQQF
jgi:UDP-N-acetylmuramoyl-L-alanyl-D-glutamate--2,6-diaminopimelate ligase